MGTNSIANATVSCLVATLLVIGFTVAPVAAADGTGISFDGDGVEVNVGDEVSVSADESGPNVEEDVDVNDTTDPDLETPEPDDIPEVNPEENADEEPVPEEVCTDVPEQVNENVPYEQVPWFSDLPPEAQPPGVPTSVVTPGAVAGIVEGASPNQCDVQDPNDPSYDPTEDEVNPAVDYDLARSGQYEDGGVALVYFDATLNDSNEHGPGVSSMVGGLGTSQFGDADTELAVHDGEKEYAVDPRVRYQDNGTTAFAENDVRLLNKRLGVVVDCDGEECQPGTRGLPQFADYPAIPAPTGEDESSEETEGPFPQEVCTDAPERVNENVPYEQVPWFSDLPSDAQPPGVPTSVVTPGAVAGIVEGASPNQCDVQDPNDPSYNPAEDGVEPAGDVSVARGGQYEDGGVVLIYYEATLNDSNEHGPGVSGMTGGLATSEFGDVDQEIAVHDGEKEYAVDPRVRYQDNGTTAFAENDVRLLNKRLGVVVDCDGEVCQPGTRGLPQFVDYPTFPAPTGE